MPAIMRSVKDLKETLGTPRGVLAAAVDDKDLKLSQQCVSDDVCDRLLHVAVKPLDDLIKDIDRLDRPVAVGQSYRLCDQQISGDKRRQAQAAVAAQETIDSLDGLTRIPRLV